MTYPSWVGFVLFNVSGSRQSLWGFRQMAASRRQQKSVSDKLFSGLKLGLPCFWRSDQINTYVEIEDSSPSGTN